MIILVGVSIGLVIKGDLFSSAEKATNGTNAKVEEEQSRVDELMKRLNTEAGKGSIKYNSDKMLNLQEGILLCKTALSEEGTQGILDKIMRINLLATDATNDTNVDDDIKSLQNEVQQLIKEIDNLRNTNQYKGEDLLKGKIARSIGADGMYLKIDDLSTTALGINNVDFSTVEKAKEYNIKVEKAIITIRENMVKIGDVWDVLEKLLIMYDEQNQIINSGVANADVEITVHSLSTMEEILNTCMQCARIAYGESTFEKEYLKLEMQYWLKGIDVIFDNAEYDGKKLLDGSFKSVSEINTTTLGNGTKLDVDITNDATIANTISKYQTAINIIEKEISKLGRTSVAKDIGNDREIDAMERAISLCEVANGELEEIINILNSIKDRLEKESFGEDEIKEIVASVEWVTRCSTTDMFGSEILLDGTFARDIGRNGVYLEISDCSSEGLGIASSTLRTDISTEAGKQTYLKKIESAITKVTTQMNNVQNIQNQLQKLVNES